MKPKVESDYRGSEEDTACLEPRRVAVRVRMQIETVHVGDHESADAGSLKPSIDIFPARHDGFLQLLYEERHCISLLCLQNI
jgi:hypothetical protein